MRGTFYQKELQKVEVSDDDMFKIEKVIKYKGRGNKKEALLYLTTTGDDTIELPTPLDI